MQEYYESLYVGAELTDVEWFSEQISLGLSLLNDLRRIDVNVLQSSRLCEVNLAQGIEAFQYIPDEFVMVEVEHALLRHYRQVAAVLQDWIMSAETIIVDTRYPRLIESLRALSMFELMGVSSIAGWRMSDELASQVEENILNYTRMHLTNSVHLSGAK